MRLTDRISDIIHKTVKKHPEFRGNPDMVTWDVIMAPIPPQQGKPVPPMAIVVISIPAMVVGQSLLAQFIEPQAWNLRPEELERQINQVLGGLLQQRSESAHEAMEGLGKPPTTSEMIRGDQGAAQPFSGLQRP
jgi:hypothetical protein